MTDGEWCIAAASVAGTSHNATGVECQDRNRAETFRAKNGETALIACVADGAGSAACGGRGAQIACERWVYRMRKYLAHSTRFSSEYGLGWSVEARATIMFHATEEGNPFEEYACTFLGACILPKRALFVQVGDGAMVIRCGPDYEVVFWPDQGEYANVTSFLTDDDAAQKTRSWVYLTKVQEVALFTDGLQRLALDYEGKGAFAPFFETMFGHLTSPRPELAEELAQFLESSAVNDRTDDDKSLVLARRHIEEMSVSPEP